MQLTIDSDDIVDIKMSTVEESQDKQDSEIITDIKKEIQSNLEDDLIVKGEGASANASESENGTDIINIKQEIQFNGLVEEEIVSNGAPDTPNNNKENDAPKDSEVVVKVENDTENSTVEIKKKQVISNNTDIEKETTSTPRIGAVKDDIVDSKLNNKLTENSTESECPVLQTLGEEKNNTSEVINSDSAKTLDEKALMNIEQIDDEVSDSTNSMDISAAKNTKHSQLSSLENDTSSKVAEDIESFDSKKSTERPDSSEIDIDANKVLENSAINEVEKSAVVESNGQLELPAETIALENETTNNIPIAFGETNNISIDEQTTFKADNQEKSNEELKNNETQKIPPTNDDNKNEENSNQTDVIVDLDASSLNESNSLSDSDKQTQCEKDKENITEGKTVPTEENSSISKSNENISSDKVIDSSTSDAVPIAIETSSDQKTEYEMAIGVSENESKSEPIGKSDSNIMSDKTSIEKSVEQMNVNSSDNETIAKNSVVDKLTEPDCFSVSSMEVDDVEIVPTENINSEISNSQDDATSISKEIDNIIEILDQDVVESSGNVEPQKKCEINSKKIDQPSTDTTEKLDEKVDISDEDDIKIVEETGKTPQTPKKEEPSVESKPLPVVCKLSNTLDILSDEEDEPPPKANKSEDKISKPENKHTLNILSDEEGQAPPKESKAEDKKQESQNKHTLDILSDEEDQPPSKVCKIEGKKQEPENKQCINIDDDDDIMLIDDAKETRTEVTEAEKEKSQKTSDKVVDETGEKQTCNSVDDPSANVNEKELITADVESPKVSEKEASPPKEIKESKPLLPIDFLKSAKKNLADMTRDELEEFCILKIVESIVDRSSLSDIKSKLKTIEKNMDDYRKKAMLLTKQNRDLQVVLKSVQEEQKTKPNSSIIPLKITRSVGMQVLMMDKPPKKKPPAQNNATPIKPINRNMVQTARPQRTTSNNQNIPVPRLIPASPVKSTPSSPITAKPQTPNGIRNSVSPAQKGPEKRPMTRQASTSNNMTVDLTDDEPPAKINKSSPMPPVRLVPSQNLMAPVRGQIPTGNPRKVFIPINGQGHNLVRGQTVMLKSAPMGPRQRLPIPRMTNQVRMNVNRHPAPLPDVTKQYQPPTWKALPPAPDLKLSKVENGIVISWKIEGYQEDSYEKIASYQLYAYQETSTPPSTALWKKIGDVKALPLPMACTLTQFMAGFKYYFAVRAVDVKSRLGPFSLPGSILLLNKM